ncbi:hypothetical protein C1894_13930 [Pseudomonas sp. FW305-3-2-15-E-TSA2]|nr:hypothetical protein C1895_23110 [Pseudomonas sp. FW305-3-2-15-E-TSA4]POA41637.1 hypothetical protein C1894_13930 [Pseudomonas sp. FW305-3-2-15-E-TSA2]
MVVETGLFASRLAPTFDRRCAQIMCSAQTPCGSEPAREGAGSISANLNNAYRSRIASVRAFNTGFSR